MHCPTRYAARTADSDWARTSERVDGNYEIGYNVSSLGWTAKTNSQVIRAISVADERMKFWTREHRRWSELFRFRRTITKDIESTAKVISHVAGELTVRSYTSSVCTDA